jgi:hypothetical protein
MKRRALVSLLLTAAVVLVTSSALVACQDLTATDVTTTDLSQTTTSGLVVQTDTSAQAPASTPPNSSKTPPTIAKATTTTVKLVGQLQTQLTLELAIPVIRYEETDSHLKWSGNWLTDTSPQASGGGYRVTMGMNPSVLVRFEGAGISLRSLKCTTSGIAKLTLDGLVYFVDLYSNNSAWQTVWSSPTLTSGIHELKIEWTGTANSEAQGTFIAVDAFDVAGTLLSP